MPTWFFFCWLEHHSPQALNNLRLEWVWSKIAGGGQYWLITALSYGLTEIIALHGAIAGSQNHISH